MRVAIAGAGAVGRSIAKELLENGHEVLLIDKDPKAIKVYSVPRAEWLLADACEISSLDDAALERCNVVIAATGDDKVNLVVSLLAKTEYGVPRVVARINHPNNEWLFNESWGVDVAVSTPRLLSALVEEAVSVGDLVRLMTFRQSEASLVELTMPADAPLAGPADRRHRVAGGHRAGRDPARRPGDRAEHRRPAGGRRRAAVRHQPGRRGRARQLLHAAVAAGLAAAAAGAPIDQWISVISGPRSNGFGMPWPALLLSCPRAPAAPPRAAGSQLLPRAAPECRRAPPRRRRRSPRTAAASSALGAAGPLITPRRNQRGPSTPMKRTGCSAAGVPPGSAG